MNIVIVTHYFLPHTGGIEFVALNEATELVKRRHTVTIVTSRLGNDPHEQHINGVRVIRVAAWNPLEHFSVPWPIFAPRELRKTLNKVIEEADIVHCHGGIYASSLSAARICRKLGKPFILTEHVGIIQYKSSVLNLIQRMAYQALGKKTYRKASVVFTLNDAVRKHVIRFGAKPAAVRHLPNGVDTHIFSPTTAIQKQRLRKTFGFPSKPVVLFVGRFTEKKGFRLVLAAASDDYQLVLAGPGNPPSEALSNPHYTFLPSQDQRKLADLYRASDIYVLPSKGEGFPLTVMEAMITGVPVITSDDPAYNTYLKGSLVMRAPTEAAAVRKAIARLLNDSTMRRNMSRAERSIALERFTWKKHTDTLLKAYAEVLA